SPNHAQKTRAAHHSLVTESRKLHRLRCPNLRDRVRAKPSRRHVWQNTDDRVRDAIECDTAAKHIRVAPEPLLPEIFCDQRDIGALFFLRPKIATENRLNPKDVEIIGR